MSEFEEEEPDPADSCSLPEDDCDDDPDLVEEKEEDGRAASALPAQKTSKYPHIADRPSDRCDFGDFAPSSVDESFSPIQVIDIECQLKRRLERFEDPEILQNIQKMTEEAECAAGGRYGRQKRPAPSYANRGMVPCIRVYGKTASGLSVCYNVYGYYPKVHVLTTEYPDEAIVKALADIVDQRITESLGRKPMDGSPRRVLAAKVVAGFPATPYVDSPCSFVELTLAMPRYVRMFGDMFCNDKYIDICGREIGVTPYSCINIVEQFQADYEISGFGWVGAENSAETDGGGDGEEGGGGSCETTHCAIERDLNVSGIRPVHGTDAIAPLRALTFDIECTKISGMPKADTNEVILIACVCSEYTEGLETRQRRVVLQYGTAKDIEPIKEGDRHYRFTGEFAERELLDAFGDLVRTYDPDYLCGHNMINFDLPYVVERANLLGCDQSAQFLGRRTNYRWFPPRRIMKERKSGEKRETTMTDTPGRIQLDTLTWIMGKEKLSSYKLGSLGDKYLGDTKMDVSYTMIGPLWRTSDETRARLAEYCLQDTVLTIGLINVSCFNMVMSSVEMSRQTRVPAPRLLRSGMQARVWGVLLEKARSPHWDDANTPVFIPYEKPKSRAKDDKYAGAIVLEPMRGYYENPIGCGDFRSLYPSIILYLNICWSTVIKHDQYKTLPHKTSPCGEVFVDTSVRRGLLGQIESELMAARDRAKAMIKKESDPGKKKLYDSRQNEIKVICNSVYGILAASGGRLVRIELGLSVTSQGQKMIMAAKGVAEGPQFGCSVIYGDSVVGNTPLFIRRGSGGLVEIVRIDDLFDEYQGLQYTRPDGKRECIPTESISVWSDSGWTPIRRVIRHEYSGDIVRVLTQTGVVDCTTDHGLVRADGARVSPVDMHPGDWLMHERVNGLGVYISTDDISEDDARTIGSLYAGGQVAEWHGIRMHNSRGEAVVPPCILNGPVRIMKKFLEGFRSALEGDKLGLIRTNNNKMTVASLIYLYQQSGCYTAIESYRDSPDVFRVFINESCCHDEPMSIRSIHTLDHVDGGLVYDLETDSHHFHVGPGDLIVHNTDSIFIKYPDSVKDADEAFGVLVKICDAVSEYFASNDVTEVDGGRTLSMAGTRGAGGCPVLLQAEKVMHPLIMINKKRYIARKVMAKDIVRDPQTRQVVRIDKFPPSLLAMGVELARRDNCQMVKDVMKAVVTAIMMDLDTPKARKVVDTTLRELLGGRVDIGRLVVTKAITKDDYKIKPMHLAVAERMHERDKSYAIGIAERIPFVIVKRAHSKIADQAEDPLWALQHDLAIDEKYYIDHQLAAPIARVFMWVLPRPEAAQMESLEKAIRKSDENKDDAETGRLEKMLKKVVDGMHKRATNTLFGPGALAAHPRKAASCGSSGIAAFCKPIERCSRCKAANAHKDGLCKSCQPGLARCMRGEPCANVVEGRDRYCRECFGRMGKCTSCERSDQYVYPDGMCPACMADMCYSCGSEGATNGLCSACKPFHESKLVGLAAMETDDMEDLIVKARAGKAECLKRCGNASDDIKCVSRDCAVLYRRATIEAKMRALERRKK